MQLSDSNSTLLTYAIATLPEPVEVGMPFSMTLSVNNQTGAPVTCTQITVTILVGTNAGDLIASGGIEVKAPDSWYVPPPSGGQVILTPPGGSIDIKGDALLFAFSMEANNQAGVSNILIDESASNANNAPGYRSLNWPVAKFPVDFTLSDLTAVPVTNTSVPYGGMAALTWVAAGEGVSCTLTYQASDGGSMDPISVLNTPEGGIYTSDALTHSDGVSFLLTASMTPLGSEVPLTKTASLFINVETLGLTLYAEPPVVGNNGLARVRWVAVNADHCIDEDTGAQLAASGEKYVVLQAKQTFSITAVGASGETLPQQISIDVDTNIAPTDTSRVITGAAGGNGSDAYFTPGRMTTEGPTMIWHPPTAGGNGADAVFIQALPPLDTAGGAPVVIEIALTGGQGGSGGSGDGGPYGDAPGGTGGNATLNLSWDPSAPAPAQYLITMAAGAGGSGAPSGTVSATVDGNTLTLP